MRKETKTFIKITFFLLGIVLIGIYFMINFIVWLRVGSLMSATQNRSMCSIAAAPRCLDYINRTDEEIQEEFSKTKNNLNVLAAIKIYQKTGEKIINELKAKNNITEYEQKNLELELKIKEYHKKIMNIINENINTNQMSFIQKRVYKKLVNK